MALRGVPICKINPKYLHSNSTSHTWPFSAIAELIDNAYDPDVNAKQIWITEMKIMGDPGLLFMDDGKGLDYNDMHKMLSFGFSDKKVVNDVQPIGMYGNGFKSGSMRLGKDAIVFSKSEDALTIGMLSQSYLHITEAEQVLVPIVSFQRERHNIELTVDQLSVSEQHEDSLRDILQYSPFNTKDSLLDQLQLIRKPETPEATRSTEAIWTTGTRILIWNLRRTEHHKELNFADNHDIRLSPDDEVEGESEMYRQSRRLTGKSLDIDYSLRAYCSILYLKPRMKIFIGGKKVKTQLITKSLSQTLWQNYIPKHHTERTQVIFGYNPKSKDHYGIMMYHKNRLMKFYERVGCQLKPNTEGVGVIGIVECNFLSPTHNKQGFDNTDMYRNTMRNLGTKLLEYCRETRCTEKKQDEIWTQCDDCLKWRELPHTTNIESLPENWICANNIDPKHRSCMDKEQTLEIKELKKLQGRNKKKKPEQKTGTDEDSLKRSSPTRDSPATSEMGDSGQGSAGGSTPSSHSIHSEATPCSSTDKSMNSPSKRHEPSNSPPTSRTKRALPFSKPKKAKIDDDDDEEEEEEDDEDNDDEADYTDEDYVANSEPQHKARSIQSLNLDTRRKGLRSCDAATPAKITADVEGGMLIPLCPTGGASETNTMEKSFSPPPPAQSQKVPTISVQTNISEEEMLGTMLDGDQGKRMGEEESKDEMSQSTESNEGDSNTDDQSMEGPPLIETNTMEKSFSPPPPAQSQKVPTISVQTNISEEEMLGTMLDGDQGKRMGEEESKDEMSQSTESNEGDSNTDDQSMEGPPLIDQYQETEVAQQQHQLQELMPAAATEKDTSQEMFLTIANRPRAADEKGGEQGQDYKSLYEHERQKAEKLMQEIDRLHLEIEYLNKQLEQQDKLRVSTNKAPEDGRGDNRGGGNS